MALALGGSMGVVPGVALGESTRELDDQQSPGADMVEHAGAVTGDRTLQPGRPSDQHPAALSNDESAESAESQSSADAAHDVAGEQNAAGAPKAAPVDEATLPRRSGQGRRVVYDISAQRVWLVRDSGRVARSYLVSGARDATKVPPGRYEVYSKSRHAVAFNYRETMSFMVRFAHGDRAPIGFHDIPRDLGKRLVQTRAELGTPTSAGCIRQARPDAVALWNFTEVGTKVVVVP
jgi:lipoprotein-anchoring transpeptidase ErfK/SrfK